VVVHCKSSIHDYVAVAAYARAGDLIKFSKLKAKAVDWNFWPPPTGRNVVVVLSA